MIELEIPQHGDGKIRKLEIPTQDEDSLLIHGVVPGITLSNARGSRRNLTNKEYLGMETGEISKSLGKAEITKTFAGAQVRSTSVNRKSQRKGVIGK